jgi:hypothetical protein
MACSTCGQKYPQFNRPQPEQSGNANPSPATQPVQTNVAVRGVIKYQPGQQPVQNPVPDKPTS